MKYQMFAGANLVLFFKAKKNRKQQTFAEEILWNYLRTKPFGLSIHTCDEVKRNDEIPVKAIGK